MGWLVEGMSEEGKRDETGGGRKSGEKYGEEEVRASEDREVKEREGEIAEEG